MTTTPQKRSRCSARSALIVAGCLAVLASCLCLANQAHAEDDLAITPAFDTQTPITTDKPIELKLSRPLKANEGSVAITINRTDLTSLFIIDGQRRVYSPALVPLPLGEAQVVVYLVSQDSSWREVGRFNLQIVKERPAAKPTPVLPAEAIVKTNGSSFTNSLDSKPVNGETAAKNESQPEKAASVEQDSPAPATANSAASGLTESTATKTPAKGKLGFEKFDYVPSVTLAIKAQPAQFNSPANSRPTQRATFTDGTLQFSMRNEMTRGWFGAQSSFDFAGSTFQAEALRFGTLGNKAPLVDLSSYLAQFKLGRAKVAIGSTSFGSSRHLINNFSSRGITVTVPVTKRFDFGVAAMNGTNIVGYGNFFGLGRSKHQLQSATFGVELIPKRPGGVRLEFSGISAYIQPLNSVSQGSVNDVERSKGGSVRLIATDKAGRFKFDGGFTRSQYRNPADPLLYQGTNTVAVPFLTRNARYFDVSYDVLRGYSLTKSKQVSLNLAVRHEQVDPLYKSLGADAGADKQQYDFQLSGSIGEISIQAGHSRFNDNLRHIASILQSLSRGQQFSVALPAAALWGGTSSTSKYLPRLSYSRSVIHQFGAAIPLNGGFATDPGAVPNQYSTSQNFSADWQFAKLTVGYNYNRSFTNNQARGRERFDFLNQTTGVRAGFNPASRLSLNLELTRDSANDLEGLKLSRTWRIGPTFSWTLNNHMSWTAGLTNTIAGDRAQTSGLRNTEFDTQFSYRMGAEAGGLKKVQSQIFIRYADRYARSRDIVFGTSNLTRAQIFNAGVNVTFF
jgi:hypothetical protein